MFGELGRIMEFLNYVHLPFGYLLPFIAALTIIVFIHELGHFLVARWCGVAVEVFSIGFGREIFGWNDRHGTRWKVCWLPLGGYVKFEGDANPTSFPQAEPGTEMTRTAGNFHGKPVWKRAAVVAAGPIANFLLSIVIFASVFAFVGIPVREPRVGEVQPGSAAEKAGIKSGDLIAAIDGVKIETFGDIVKSVSFRGGELLQVTIDRNGTPISLQIVAGVVEEPDGFGGTSKRGLLGVSPPKDAVASAPQRLSIPDAIAQGTERNMAHRIRDLQVSRQAGARAGKFKANRRPGFDCQNGGRCGILRGYPIRYFHCFPVDKCRAY